MPSLLNSRRPPVFCPGCSHERVVHATDHAFQQLGLSGDQIVLVSDIGCSGLFDTFFHTHAFHGLHGRALTYATGLKLARPELTVVVTMGDGGLGIGGAHFLSACRRNLNVTLLILNNFNFGMTGGQYSATTPTQASVSSGFLNQLDLPMDVCQTAASAGAPYIRRCSAYQKDLSKEIEAAIRFDGFSVLDIWGVCTGRYTKRNQLTPKQIEENIAALGSFKGPVEKNFRKEYGAHYRELASAMRPAALPARITAEYKPPTLARQEIIILGSAGQRILTAGELLCLAGMTAGLKVTQKNEYDITVLRGPSITEVILSPEEIDFTGIQTPTAILALSQEGVSRRQSLFDHLNPETLILQAHDVTIPACQADIHIADFNTVKSSDRAIAALSMLAGFPIAITPDMLRKAVETRFNGSMWASILEFVPKLRS